MDDQTARVVIHEALRQRHFERVPGAAGAHTYIGAFQLKGGQVPIQVQVRDLDFVSYPDISIGPHWPIPGRRVPHVLGPGGTICYYAAGSVVLDRYNPDGTVLQCLDRAETVLREALQGKLDRDFEAEFPAYWAGTWMLYDLPRKFAGAAKVHFISLDGGPSKTPVLHGKKSWLLTRHSGPPMSSPEPVTVLRVEDALSINPRGIWPPNKLSELLEWLSFVDPTLGAEIDKALVSSEGALTTIGLQALNGLFVVRIEVPDRFRTTEFLKTRRKILPKIMRSHAREVKVERITANAADLDYIYGRNLGSLSGLAGKRILLIGCGTIGSFLAQQLAQSGAGIDGRFLAVDNDVLKPANLGRHLLGVPYLHRNKAEACAEFLNSQLPGAKIEGREGDVLPMTDLGGFDLVIDATGEEALSITLNQRAVTQRPDSPPHLFVWLLGNGAIAQALLVDSPANACLKCLKPELAGQPRFRALRPEVDVEIGSIMACADADFVPFPVSRPTAAASLACDMVLDWANGRPGDHLRSYTFDPRQAYQISNSTPSALDRCPACGQNH